MEQRFVDALPTARSRTEAATIAGYACPTVDATRALKRQDVLDELERQRQERAARLEAVADKAIEVLPAKLDKASANECSLIASRSIETAQLLRGQPTSISASVNVDLDASDIAARFGLDPARVLADLSK